MYSRPQTGPTGSNPQGNPIPTVQSAPAPSKPTDFNAYNAGYGKCLFIHFLHRFAKSEFVNLAVETQKVFFFLIESPSTIKL